MNDESEYASDESERCDESCAEDARTCKKLKDHSGSHECAGGHQWS